MEERIRNSEDFAHYATEIIVLMEEDRRATREAIRRLGENSVRRDELLQRILHTVAVMRADIIRIDESRSWRRPRTAEDRQSTRKPVRRLDDNDKGRKEAMRRMLQAAAAIQADIARRDEAGA